MCLGVTAQVIKIEGQKAEVEFDGVTQIISIAMTPEVKVGEFVMLHAGFAISIIDRQQAEETMDIFKELKKMIEEEEDARNARR